MTASIIRFVAKTSPGPAPTRNSNNFNEQMSRIPTKNVKSCCCRPATAPSSQQDQGNMFICKLLFLLLAESRD